MRTVMQQYGTAMIAMIAAGAVLLVLGMTAGAPNGGIIGELGEAIVCLTAESPRWEKATQAMAAAKTRGVPEVRANSLVCGVSYLLEDMIAAKDCDGGRAEVRVLALCERDGQRSVQEEVYAPVTDRYCFVRPGIYRMQVAVADAQGATTSGWLYVSVNAKGNEAVE